MTLAESSVFERKIVAAGVGERAVRGTSWIGENAPNLDAGFEGVASPRERQIVDNGGGGIVFLLGLGTADRGESSDLQTVRQGRDLLAAKRDLVETEPHFVEHRGRKSLIQGEHAVDGACVGDGAVAKIAERVIGDRFVDIDTEEGGGGIRESMIEANHSGGFVGALRTETDEQIGGWIARLAHGSGGDTH